MKCINMGEMLRAYKGAKMDKAESSAKRRGDKARESREIIIFFGGFGSLPRHFLLFFMSYFLENVCEIFMVYDYSKLGFDNLANANEKEQNLENEALESIEGIVSLKNILERAQIQKKKITLLCFSMGVCVASRIMPLLILRDNISRAIAINGTNYGIDEKFGIHPRIFARVVRTFNREAFAKNLYGECFSVDKNLAKNLELGSERALKAELESLERFCKARQNLAFFYDDVFISMEDKIFPSGACREFFMQENVGLRYASAKYDDIAESRKTLDSGIKKLESNAQKLDSSLEKIDSSKQENKENVKSSSQQSKAKKSNIFEIDAPHFLFHLFSLQDLLKMRA